MSSRSAESRMIVAIVIMVLLLAELAIFEYLKRSELLVLMWHVPILLALYLTFRAVLGGSLVPAATFAMLMMIVGGLLFFSGGALVSGLALVWVLLTAAGQTIVRTRDGDRA